MIERPLVHVDRDQRFAKYWVPGARTSAVAVSLKIISQHFWRLGMSTLALNADERVASVDFSDDFLIVGLMDG